MMPDYFELFQLPATFELDRGALDTAWRNMQQVVHPDRFVNAPDAEQRAAMQWATYANEAYQTLRQPLKRAMYLCELNGFSPQLEMGNAALTPEFLIAQIGWRETLENARMDKDLPALETLSQELQIEHQAFMTRLQEMLNNRHFPAAVQLIRQMMFLEKLREEINFAFDALDTID